MDGNYYVYIMTNSINDLVYTGITCDLRKIVYDHKFLLSDNNDMFNLNKLMYYEVFDNVENAIFREMRIRRASEKVLMDLINSTNGEWKDLYKEIKVQG